MNIVVVGIVTKKAEDQVVVVMHELKEKKEKKKSLFKRCSQKSLVPEFERRLGNNVEE